MVAINESYPFAVGAGSVITQEQWSQMNKHAVADGVLKTRNVVAENGEFLLFADSTGMNVKVNSGDVIIQGFMGRSFSQITLPIAASHPTTPRSDTVVLRLTKATGQITLEVITGTPASGGPPPAHTQSASIWDIVIGYVFVNPGVSTISAASIYGPRTFAGHQVTKRLGTAQSTTSSTSFADMSEMRVDLFTKGGDVLVQFAVDLQVTGAGNVGAFVGFGIRMDAGSDSRIATYTCRAANDIQSVAGFYLFEDVRADWHSWFLRWFISSGSVVAQTETWKSLMAMEILD